MEQNWNQYFFNFIKKHFDKPWNFYYLSKNPNITWDIVEANPDKLWNWYGLSKNPNITWDIVEANHDKDWNWFRISYNTFQKEKEVFELRVKKQKFIQENIFEELVKIAMHPKKIEKYLNMGYSIDELDYLL